MKRLLLFFRLAFFALCITVTTAIAQPHPSLSTVDRVRLAEGFSLADTVGDRLWTGWSKAPFSVLLVTPHYEFLMRHPHPSADFTRIGYDELLKSDVFYRERRFQPNLLATFPAINGSMVSTIVIGQAENTMVKTSTPWIITLLHEHFHQLQDSQPDFYADVNALNLAGEDQTGMWMLNYAFPYDRSDVQEQFVAMSRLLAAAVEAPKAERLTKVRQYLEAREKFQSLISPIDDRYIAFQFWKEGIARYTEYHVARLAAQHYRPSKAFRALNDYQSFNDAARKIYEVIFRQLMTQKLGDSRREVVYSFGAAEGLLLDRINPRWRSQYFIDKFRLERLLRSRWTASPRKKLNSH